MTRNSSLAALLGVSLLLVGCGDRNAQTGQNPPENTAVAQPVEAPPPVTEAPPVTATPASPQVDNRLVEPRRPATPAPPATAGHHAAESERPVAAPSLANRPAAPAAPEWREVTIASGTAMPLELTTPLSSETASVETPVRARLRQPIVVNGYTALPAGTVLTGQVTDVERSGRVQGRARLTFAFSEARIDGSREELRSDPLTFEAEATKGEDATKVGAGAGVGAVIGGILGGGKGAAKGAAIGGAAGGGAVLATRGKEVELASGRDITATLGAPLTVRVALNR